MSVICPNCGQETTGAGFSMVPLFFGRKPANQDKKMAERVRSQK